MITQNSFLILKNKKLSTLNFHLVFNAPPIARAAKPGQFVEIGVPGCLLKRPFSIFDVRGPKVAIIYKVVGKGTAALTKIKKGDTIDVIGPLGTPFPAIPGAHKKILVGGGVGVPPLYFLARKQKGEIAFLGAKTKSDLLCAGDFKKLGLRVVTATQDGSAGQKAVVIAPFQKYFQTIKDKNDYVVFTCGPTPMMRAVAQICAQENVKCFASLEAIMACGIGVCMGCVVKVKQDRDFIYHRVCTEGPVMEAEKILWE